MTSPVEEAPGWLERLKPQGDADGVSQDSCLRVYLYFHASREKQLSREPRGAAAATDHPRCLQPWRHKGWRRGTDREESKQSGVRRTSSSGSEEPSPPVSSGVAAPRFSACPIEQRGFECPRLGRRRDKASLAQIALRKKFRRAPEPAGGTVPSSLSRHLREGQSLTEEGANQGKTAEQGTEPKTPSRQAGAWPPHPGAPPRRRQAIWRSKHLPRLAPSRKVTVQRPGGSLQQTNATRVSLEQERFKIYIIYTFIIHPLTPLYANHELVSAVTFP